MKRLTNSIHCPRRFLQRVVSTWQICYKFCKPPVANDQRTSNHVHHGDTIVEKDSTYTGGILPGGCTSGGQKVLGVSWNPISDTLEFDNTEIAKSLHELKPTKRNIVGVASRVYNPLRFLSPVVVSLKIIFQELCRSRIDWDDPLPQELELKWKGIVSKFHGTVMSLPRHYFGSTGKRQPCLLWVL